MKKINQQATKIFCQLLKKMNCKEYIKLVSENFMPLSIEQIEGQINTPWGVSKLYSVSHTYEQNGDLMRDPEMVFIVRDKRNGEKDYDNIHVYPQMYQQDNLGLYEESACIQNGQLTTFIKTWQHGHCSFANMWMKNIQQQGFLK
jgi:hypothetical protein